MEIYNIFFHFGEKYLSFLLLKIRILISFYSNKNINSKNFKLLFKNEGKDIF